LKPADTLTGSQQFVLVLFRFSIGWHLFYQGWGKIQAAHWSSESYLRAATGPLAAVFERMANQPLWLRLADQGTMWGLTILGLLLMIGLFTRAASLLSIGLLLLFYAALPPLPFHGFAVRTPDGTELYVNKVLIEILALLVSLVFDTGKISGLDMLVGPWLRRVRSRGNREAAPVDLI
jgi:thiosulfate dehydrogenase [quinone] large subunit